VDRAGRKILFALPRLRSFRDITNFVSRTYWVCSLFLQQFLIFTPQP
jgi:hypothetical protein